ncbi:MAG: hypothetical protein H7061_13490 [Bdellovibrionaceae bacterium]|nr:hypothetical protein [Bdellovibrio sp.]
MSFADVSIAAYNQFLTTIKTAGFTVQFEKVPTSQMTDGDVIDLVSVEVRVKYFLRRLSSSV